MFGGGAEVDDVVVDVVVVVNVVEVVVVVGIVDSDSDMGTTSVK